MKRSLPMTILAALVVAAGACGGDDLDDHLWDERQDEWFELLSDRYQLSVWDNDNVDIRTTIHAVAEVDRVGRVLLVRPCSSALPKVLGFTPSLAPDGIRNIVVELPFRVSASRLVTEPTALQFGVELDDPHTDAVPSDPSDPRVIDHDRDGNPGISILVGLGRRVYAGVSMIVSLDGSFSEPEAIAGRAPLSIDKQIYGDNIPFFNAQKAAAERGELGRKSRRGYFSMTELEPSEVPLSCHDIP